MCLRPQKLRKHHQCQASFVEAHVFHVEKEERWCGVDQTDQNHLREDLNYMQSKIIHECLFNIFSILNDSCNQLYLLSYEFYFDL